MEKQKEVYSIEEGRKLIAGGKVIEKKKKNHPESELQVACVTWFRLQYPQFAKLLFAIPNGGARNAVEAKIMSTEGIVPGVADLMLAVPYDDKSYTTYHGFFIEMKATTKQTPNQKEFMDKVHGQGYKYEVCKSVDQFMQIITDYLK